MLNLAVAPPSTMRIVPDWTSLEDLANCSMELLTSLPGGVVGFQRQDVAGHHRVDGRRQRNFRQDHATDKVGARQNSAQTIAAISIHIHHDD